MENTIQSSLRNLSDSIRKAMQPNLRHAGRIDLG
jgi:hypothetical protein